MTITPRGSFVRAESPYRIRRRYQNRLRLFGLLTIIMAGAWCIAAYQIYRYILHLEFVGIFTGGINVGPDGPRLDLRFMEKFIDVRPEYLLANAVSVIEVSSAIWLGLMWVIGLSLLICGALAQPGRLVGRKSLLSAGIIVLLGTVLTLVEMFMLIRYGDFPPTITPLGYTVITSVHSAYGWLLLLVFARKPRIAL